MPVCLYRRGKRCLGVITCLATVLLVLAPDRARADELDALHARILRNPADSELSLRFARLAEASGTLRWALAAYERVLVNDPNNVEAQNGLQRVRRALQPAFTLVTAELGGGYETNPRYYLPPKRGEWIGLGSVALRDERSLAGTRWRTEALAAGKLYQRSGDLNFGYVGIDTGPIIDLWAGWSVHPALGAAAAYFDHHYYFGEAAASLTFEGNLQGAYQAVRVRAAYRSFDDFFPSQEGPYVEARGKFAKPNVLGDASVAIFSPWLLWSDISGAVTNALITTIQPGAYLEWGGRFELYKGVAPWLTIGGQISVAERDYRTDLVPGTGSKREDVIVSPGATLLFPNLFAYQTDLRLDYKYLKDRSNDPTKTFDDHLVSATVVSRFDPFLPRATAR
jgi:hypothetical protein